MLKGHTRSLLEVSKLAYYCQKWLIGEKIEKDRKPEYEDFCVKLENDLVQNQMADVVELE